MQILKWIAMLQDAGETMSSSGSSFYTASEPASFRTATSGAEQRPEEARSQVSIDPGESASQVTMKGPVPTVNTQGSTLKSSQFPSVGNLPTPKQNYGGLEPDTEGKETRKEMLKRRRQECKAEDVDVALAPVLKINVPYVFYPQQYKAFKALFPRINVDSGLSYTHHDHPVAHTATMVGIRRMQGMLSSGQRALDLHGNPNGNEQFNRFQQSRLAKRPGLPQPPTIESMVNLMTAGDAVRKVTKWGPEFDLTTEKPRWAMGDLEDIEPGKYDVFMSAHTLYYYSMYRVCKLMNKNPGTKLIALVNYSPEQSGTLYGELKFSKSDGMTTQTSPNGEKYYHPDIDQWFQTNSFRGLTETVDSGISWTSTNIGGPLYIITITKCDWGLSRHAPYMPPVAPTLKVTADRNFMGIIRIGGKDVRLNITNLQLASELRHYMTFRDRNNPQTLQDLVTKARRITSLDIVNGSRMHTIGDGELQDHITYAFVVDTPGELELLEGIKLLKGDLLIKHSESLKLEGKVNKAGFTDLLPFYNALFGRSTYAPALSGRSKPSGVGALQPRSQNSGGLLPTTRT
jgi:hypothetical protein